MLQKSQNTITIAIVLSYLNIYFYLEDIANNFGITYLYVKFELSYGNDLFMTTSIL